MIYDVISETIVGGSPAIAQVRALVARLAPSDIPVLIQGPTGCGKELVARALHAASGRSGNLVAFNVCAIADTMFEDALFGHVRGAFTGAMTDTPGYFAQADRGTVMLDEVGDLPLDRQAKLLRVLDTRQYRPVGAKADRSSDFRLVSATNHDLDANVSKGSFRLDLAHRLSAALINVPPLVDRLEDVPELARCFAARARTACGGTPEFAAGALAALGGYHWPGNVRELKHVIERAAAMSDSTTLTADVVQAALRPYSRHGPVAGADGALRAQLLELLQRCEWDTGRVAGVLQVHRGTVYRRMQSLGIRTPKWVTGRADGDHSMNGSFA